MAASVLRLKRLPIFAIACLCLCLSLPARSETVSDDDFLYKAGLEHLEQHDFHACGQTFELLTYDINCVGCWLNLAICQQGYSDYSGCTQTMDRFLALTNDESAGLHALHQKASCLALQKDYFTCLTVCDEALFRIDGQSSYEVHGVVLAHKAFCLSRLGFFNECIRVSKQALNLPDNLDSHLLALNNKAFCLMQQGDYPDCIEVSDQMLNRVYDSDYLIAGLKHKAACQARMQDYSGCVASYDQLQYFSTANTSAMWANKAACLAMQHDFDGCIEAANKGMALGGDIQKAQKIRETCLTGKENPEKFRLQLFFPSF